MKNHVVTYCEESSIHGFPYIVNQDLHIVEKLLWTAALIVSFIWCGFLIFQIGVKFQEDAFVTYTSDSAIDVTDIPFAAVTICPDLLNYNHEFDYNETITKLKQNEIKITRLTLRDLNYMQAIALATGDEFMIPYNLTLVGTEYVMAFIRKLLWCYSSRWFTRETSFDDEYDVFFARVIGSTGYCYNFNMADPDEIFNLEILPSFFNFSRIVYQRNRIEKYLTLTKRPNKSYPMKVTDYQSGLYSHIKLISWSKLFENYELNHHEKFNYQGINYLIHSPYELPTKFSAKHQTVANHSMIVYLNPKKAIINEALKAYEPKRFEQGLLRGCYLENEKPLKFFKKYTKNNCKSECLSNQTLSVCGCVQFFMVREKSTRICGVLDMKCYKKVDEEFEVHNTCDCFLECGEIVYKTEQQINNFAVTSRQVTKDTETLNSNSYRSILQIFFKNQNFFPFVIQQELSALDFVSYCGGSLGLFLGFSVTSAVEILYYFTLKILCLKAKRKVIPKLSDTTTKKKNFLIEIIKNSSVHGFNQITMKNRHIIERFFWILFVVVTLALCYESTYSLFLNYKSSPVMMKHDEIINSSRMIEFPAVTFNNEIRFNFMLQYYITIFGFASELFKAKDFLKSMGGSEEIFVKASLCDSDLALMKEKLQINKLKKSEQYMKIVRDLYQTEWFLNQTASWNTIFKTEFTEVLTRRGFGFAFNMLPKSKLFTENLSEDFLNNQTFALNFPDSTKPQKFIIKDFPLKTTTRDGNGLKIILDPSHLKFGNRKNDWHTCKPLSFIVHSPYELPGSYDWIHLFEFDYYYDFEVLITPEIVRSDDNLRSFDPKERGCYFEGERKLKYFQVYTRRNCEFECFSENMNQNTALNCTPFFVVRENSFEICDYRKDVETREETFYALRDIAKCNCLDECNSIKYNVEVIAHTLASNETLIIDFKFKDVDIVPLRRYQPITFSDFLAQSGGMMGLFAGISALSVIELLYFLSLRWIVNIWRWIKKIY